MHLRSLLDMGNACENKGNSIRINYFLDKKYTVKSYQKRGMSACLVGYSSMWKYKRVVLEQIF